LKPYKETIDLFVLAEVDELIMQFDEGLATMNNLLASRFVRPMRAKAEKI
jgi:dynein heavy chain